MITHEVNREERGPRAGYARVDGDVVEILDGMVVGIPSAEEMLSKVHEHRRQHAADAVPVDSGSSRSPAADVERDELQVDDVSGPAQEGAGTMAEQSTNETGGGAAAPLFDLRTFVIVLVTVGVGLLLYFAPAVGAALLGALTVLGLLALLIRR